MIHPHSPNRSLCSASQYKLDRSIYLPIVHKYGDRTLAVAAAKLWNGFPSDIRESAMTNSNPNNFKFNIETYLYAGNAYLKVLDVLDAVSAHSLKKNLGFMFPI